MDYFFIRSSLTRAFFLIAFGMGYQTFSYAAAWQNFSQSEDKVFEIDTSRIESNPDGTVSIWERTTNKTPQKTKHGIVYRYVQNFHVSCQLKNMTLRQNILYGRNEEVLTTFDPKLSLPIPEGSVANRAYQIACQKKYTPPSRAKPLYFGDYLCTKDCSGHKAGYAWAEKNDVENEEDCVSRSRSFTEGCLVYLEEQDDDY